LLNVVREDCNPRLAKVIREECSPRLAKVCQNSHFYTTKKPKFAAIRHDVVEVT